jgi:hypothetical protein
MNISSASALSSKSIEAANSLLKDITETSNQFQEKIVKVAAVEALTGDDLGQNIDITA